METQAKAAAAPLWFGMWRTSSVFILKPLCTKRLMISSNHCWDWTVTLWQKRLEWNKADLGTRRACSWTRQTSHPSAFIQLQANAAHVSFWWEQQLCGRPQRARWMRGFGRHSLRPPMIHLTDPSRVCFCQKSSMEKPARWTCGQQRRRGEM